MGVNRLKRRRTQSGWWSRRIPPPHEQVLAEFGLTVADWENIATSTDS